MAFLLNRKNIFFLALYLFLFFITCTNALFWDTMQFASFHPSWYYYNDFKYLWLPEVIDSGHPPFFGLYLAAVWKVLGRNLLATHLAMLPFVITIVVQAGRLGNILFGRGTAWSFICTLIVLSETALLGQIILASPDVILMAAFLLAINSILTNSKLHLAIAAIFLSIISTRGMMCVAALYIFSLAYTWEQRKSFSNMLRYCFTKAIPFLAGGILAVAYLVMHRIDTGWGGFNRNSASSWSAGFERVGTSGIIHNLIILVWRIADLGKVFTVLLFLILLVVNIVGKTFWKLRDDSYKMLKKFLVFVVALFFVSALPLCFFAGLMGHRYLLPFTTVTAITVVLMLAKTNSRYKYVLATIMVAVQLSGNFWVYPAGLSTGWDTTLAQMPYYSLRENFKRYIKEKAIPQKEISSQFPLWSSEYGIDLGTDTTRYSDAIKVQTKYVWYSNVCNNLQDSADYYFKNFRVLKYEKKGQVEMALFERK